MLGISLFRGKEKRFGIALGGGAVWSFAHLGVLEVLEENGIRIDGIAGTSSGSIVASFYAFGLRLHEIKEIGLKLTLSNFFHWKISKLGLSGTDRIKELVRNAIGEHKIGESLIPLFITATDLLKSEQHIFDENCDVCDAVAASCAIPGIFVPVEIGEKMFVDGSLLADVNCKALRENGFDVVVGVELINYSLKSRPSNMFEVILESYQSMVERNNREMESYADFIIKPNINGIGRFEIDKAPILIQKGREAASEIVFKIKELTD